MDATQIAVQIIHRGSGYVAAQRVGWIGSEAEMEQELGLIVLSDYQRLRTVQAEHWSVADFNGRIADIQADVDRRSA